MKQASDNGEKAFSDAAVLKNFNSEILRMLVDQEASHVFANYRFKTMKHIRNFRSRVEKHLAAEEILEPHKEKVKALTKSLYEMDDAPILSTRWPMRTPQPIETSQSTPQPTPQPSATSQLTPEPTASSAFPQSTATSFHQPPPPTIRQSIRPPFSPSMPLISPILPVPNPLVYPFIVPGPPRTIRPTNSIHQPGPFILSRRNDQPVHGIKSVLSSQPRKEHKIRFVYECLKKVAEGENATGQGHANIDRWRKLNLTQADVDEYGDLTVREFKRMQKTRN